MAPGTPRQMREISLNLGSGRKTSPDTIDVDKFHAAGLDVQADLEKGLPFRTGSVDRIHCSHALEHLCDVGSFITEVWRILKPGGVIRLIVPYGFNYNPYHRRYFTEESVSHFLVGEQLEAESLEYQAKFALLSQRITERRFPLKWHLRRYLHLKLNWLGWKSEIEWLLQKPVQVGVR